ncbi:MAG: hypothetical protein KKH76_01715 [Euryarchaeota archaeon]|nr:hypothetical protein [Euryarchaeota archaeon]
MICNSYYGYKFHIKTDIDYGLMRESWKQPQHQSRTLKSTSPSPEK